MIMMAFTDYQMSPALDDFVADAISGGDTDFYYSSPSNAQNLLIEFNLGIGDLIVKYKLELIGKAIWYLYGIGSNTTHDALDPSADNGLPEFYGSLEELYNNGFAQYCENAEGHSDRNPNSFATACYMLWDMDSGLEYHTLRGRSELFPFAEKLIDFGLAHNRAAVQESFLHCLGHLHYVRASFVESKITQFLRRSDLDADIREYAEACHGGGIQ
jgi:hypothetical protein